MEDKTSNMKGAKDMNIYHGNGCPAVCCPKRGDMHQPRGDAIYKQPFVIPTEKWPEKK